MRHRSPDEHRKVRRNQVWDSYLRLNGALEKRAITVEKDENISPPGNSTEDTFFARLVSVKSQSDNVKSRPLVRLCSPGGRVAHSPGLWL